jgi:hypothetical protein
MHGQFTWYELTTPDVDAAKKFYPRFTGWGTQAFDKDYTMWTSGGVPIAGIFQLTPEMRAQGIPPNWMPYVETSDVDETAKKCVSLGGKVNHGPADIPGTGSFAVLQDPQGAVFGVYKSNAGSMGWDGTPVVGRFSWHELMTTDYAKAFEFYRGLFGWEKTGEMDMGGGAMYYMFGRGQKMYGGMFNRVADMASMPPFWLCYIHVKDVKKAVAAATKAGGSVHREPMDIPGGMIAIMGDPQGAGFAVHHESAPAFAAKPAAKKAVKKAAKASSPATVKSKPKAKAAAKKTKPKLKAAAKKAKPKAKAATKLKKRVKSAKAKPKRKSRPAVKRRSASKKAKRRR